MNRLFISLVLLLFCVSWNAAAETHCFEDCCAGEYNGSSTMGSVLLGEEVYPMNPVLTEVQLFLRVTNSHFEEDFVTVELREGAIDGPLVPGTTVSLIPPLETGDGAWISFPYDAPVAVTPGATYVLTAWNDSRRYGWTRSNACRETSTFRYGFVEECTTSASLECSPASGTLPFTTQMTVGLENHYLLQARRLAVIIDVRLANGVYYSHWRAGFKNISHGEIQVYSWGQNFPLLGSLEGVNTFSLTAMDITPAPYNQPPYHHSGHFGTEVRTVTAMLP